MILQKEAYNNECVVECLEGTCEKRFKISVVFKQNNHSFSVHILMVLFHKASYDFLGI